MATYYGTICKKHPELGGKRYSKAGGCGPCAGCVMVRNKKWRTAHMDAVRLSDVRRARRHKDDIRRLVFDHYGRKCSACGFDNPGALFIDHINGKGAKHTTHKWLEWLVVNKFPKDFGTFCVNCLLTRR